MKFAGFGALIVWGLAGVASAEYSVELDLSQQRAYLLDGNQVVLESPISSGRAGHLTPTGTFRITNKDYNHVSSIYGKIINGSGKTVVLDADVDMHLPAGTRFVNAPMHYFMQFAPGIGMHAGYLPGYAASHGCVRMPQDMAIAFFQRIRVGTRVTVHGETPVERQYVASNRSYRVYEQPYQARYTNERRYGNDRVYLPDDEYYPYPPPRRRGGYYPPPPEPPGRGFGW